MTVENLSGSLAHKATAPIFSLLMTFESIGECNFHHRKFDCPMTLIVYICISIELERVGSSSLAHFDVVRLLKPSEEESRSWVSIGCAV